LQERSSPSPAARTASAGTWCSSCCAAAPASPPSTSGRTASTRSSTFQVDITDRAAVEELPTKVADRFGVVDGLVNVAHIANVSSMGGFLPVPGQTVYGASKAAVKLLVRVRRMMSHRVRRIVSVHPG
jgi:NADP-dependent 3-hydroxy acid dehydrogenase YdfG